MPQTRHPAVMLQKQHPAAALSELNQRDHLPEQLTLWSKHLNLNLAGVEIGVEQSLVHMCRPLRAQSYCAKARVVRPITVDHKAWNSHWLV